MKNMAPGKFPHKDIFKLTWSRFILRLDDEALKIHVALHGDKTTAPAQTTRPVQIKTETINGISFPATEQEGFGVQVPSTINSTKKQVWADVSSTQQLHKQADVSSAVSPLLKRHHPSSEALGKKVHFHIKTTVKGDSTSS